VFDETLCSLDLYRPCARVLQWLPLPLVAPQTSQGGRVCRFRCMRMQQCRGGTVRLRPPGAVAHRLRFTWRHRRSAGGGNSRPSRCRGSSPAGREDLEPQVGAVLSDGPEGGTAGVRGYGAPPSCSSSRRRSVPGRRVEHAGGVVATQLYPCHDFAPKGDAREVALGFSGNLPRMWRRPLNLVKSRS
jgi:hypothetical protein